MDYDTGLNAEEQEVKMIAPNLEAFFAETEEDRARRVHEQSTIFISHDHQILRDDIELMRLGGVTAKHLQISLDGQTYADKETFLSSVSPRDRRKELKRIVPDEWESILEDESQYLMAGEPTGFLRRALVAMDYINWQSDNSSSKTRIAYEPSDILDAKEAGQIALLLGSEGSRLIEGRLEVLRALYKLGLRELGLSWAFETPAGSPQGDESGNGLTEFGRTLVDELNRLGMMIDVDHLSISAIEDVLEASEAPILASHAGAAALNPGTPCCYDDGLLRAIAEQGGVVAIHFMSQQVKPGRDLASIDDLTRQFAYVGDLIGADHMACGPDYATLDPRKWENQHISTPFSWVEGLENPSQFLNVTRALVRAGFEDGEIESILGGSLLRLFAEVRNLRRPTYEFDDPQQEDLGVVTEGTTPL